jgi:hypothetical protein
MGRHKDASKIPSKYVEKRLLHKSNELKPVLTDDEKAEVVANIVGEKTFKKEASFFLYWIFGVDPKRSALLSGYKESYAYKLITKYRKDRQLRELTEQVLDSFPDKYRLMCKARLLELSRIEGQAIEEYRKDPKLLIDKPQLAKQVKQAAGVLLGEDIRQVIPLINIEEMRVLIKSKIDGTLTERQGEEE